MKPVTDSLLNRFGADYEASAERHLATLALSKSELSSVAFSSKGANAMRQKFSVEVPTLEVTNQKSSGRCWLFAATNVLRERIAQARNLENFELSQSYLAFWDKFERCNYFLESILETAALPTTDRTVMHILSTGVHDGGQWDMFANIVRKYGVVPKDVYDETYQSSNTRSMNAQLNRALKVAAAGLRRMAADKAGVDAIQAEKNKTLDAIYGFLCSCYGEPPKDVYDETYQSSNTRSMNVQLNRALKVAAAGLRRMAADKAGADAIQAEKNKTLDAIYGFLCSCYGEPPKAFDFEFVDKDQVYHIEKNLTPLTFAERYVGDLLDQVVSVINAPTADKPYHKTYTIRLLGNVVEGRPVVHLNLTMDELKAAIIAQLKAGKVVWFGSDVGHFGERTLGVWDDRSFDFAALTGLSLAMDKADALDYGLAAMNHAMVLTGVNLDEAGKPTRWKIENSWGDKNGEKGYYVCSDSWFDQYVFQAAVEREYLGGLADLAAQEPIVLEPWDPMGTLAD